MPTYEYKCDNCGHGFDVFQSMKDDKLTKCPNCGKETLRRLIGSGGGLIFKGSGFYLTDYKNKPEGSGKANSNNTASTKTETAKTDDQPAPAAAAESKPSETLPKKEKKSTKPKKAKD